MSEWKMAVIYVVGIVTVAVAITIGSAYFEARAYNSITGKNVSTWDALFVELRVQEPAK